MAFVFPIRCTKPGCTNSAEYKIAAHWSDGQTAELKTYGLTCSACLSVIYQQTLEKQQRCRLAPGEVLEPAGIYHLAHGHRDDQLARLADLEARCRG